MCTCEVKVDLVDILRILYGYEKTSKTPSALSDLEEIQQENPMIGYLCAVFGH